MKWMGRRESGNVEGRRGSGGGGRMAAGGGIGALV
ncbi:MAG: metalloprotease, partial [Chitinophagaceae bacterium]